MYSLFHVPAGTLVENNLWGVGRPAHVEEHWSGKASMNTVITHPYVLLKGSWHPGCCRWYIQTHILMKGNSITEGPPWPESELGL